MFYFMQRPARRLLVLAGAVGGFGVLFFGASQLGLDLSILGVSDEALRPIAHFGVYGLLAAMLAQGLGSRYGIAWILSMIFATSEELHQMIVPGRYTTLADWLINLAGISIALLTLSVALPYLRYHLERRRYRQALIAEGEWHPWSLRRVIARTPRPGRRVVLPPNPPAPLPVSIPLSDRKAPQADGREVCAAA